MNNKILITEIGGTHLRIAKSTIFAKDKIELSDINKYHTQDFLKNIPNSIFGQIKKTDLSDITGLVFAVAGPVEEDGIVIKLPNIKVWPENFDLGSMAKTEFNLPVLVVNDMDTAVKGMAFLDKNLVKFWGITWSTGLGARYWDGNKTYYGELGHEIKLEIDSKQVEAEDILGGNHLKEYLRKNYLDKMSENDPIKILANSFRSNEDWAKKIYFDLCQNFARFLDKLLEIKDTQVIVLKGSIAEFVLSETELREYLQQKIKSNVRLIKSVDGDKDSFYGAALLFDELI
jgi:predicted NBD/HSP70 family sugar kinase